MKMNRRHFLKSGLSGLAYFSAASTVPAWVSKSAVALSKALDGDKILVIVQQAGGNDGLNTVIPYMDDLYNGVQLRPNLHITSGLEGTLLDDLNAFHPKLTGLKTWWDKGNLAVIQNVGYPNPNLSHFVATDYWELGTSTGSNLVAHQGWASRFFDSQCAGIPPEQIDALSMLAAGRFNVPLTFANSSFYVPPAVDSFDSYAFAVPPDPFGSVILEGITAINEASGAGAVNPQIDFLYRAHNTAELSIADIQAASQVPAINAYPAGELGGGLDMVSKVIRGGFGTRIFYVSQGGYDTHANQFQLGDPINLGDHPRLLSTFDAALDAFMGDMEAAGLLDKVLVMTFSEFGRRVSENGSFGTDHGTGNCLFILGGAIDGGIYGGQPTLDDASGNLPHAIDYRAVYAKVIRDWFGADPEPIFGSADYNSATFDIQGSMEQIPFLGVTAPPNPADVDESGSVDALDIQLVINGALGIATGVDTDVDGDSKTNALDIQLTINAALGL